MAEIDLETAFVGGEGDSPSVTPPAVGVGGGVEDGGQAVDPAMIEALMASGAAPASQFPSTDPNFVGSIISQILSAQQDDMNSLMMAQQQALMDNPILQSILVGLSGADGRSHVPSDVAAEDQLEQ